MTKLCITIALLTIFSTNFLMGQTKAQIDSLIKEVLEQIKNTPTPSDSIIAKHKLREAKRLAKLDNPDPLNAANVIKYEVTSSPTIFETSFFDSTKIQVDSFLLSFYAVDIGKLHIETGKIIACDPIIMSSAKPFVQVFPNGNFSVQLSIAKVANNERVAFSRIVFTTEAVAKWEFALDSGNVQVSIDGETFYGYSVDGGIGVFIDEQANQRLSADLKNHEDLWDEIFSAEMNTHNNAWQYFLYNYNGYSFASFSTGFGDGRYATYVGYDNKGNICRLLTDFRLVNWWKK
jgi:hypothetical protein